MEHGTLGGPRKPARAWPIEPGSSVESQLAMVAFTPILALWPLVSTLPLFGLLAGPETIGWGVMHLFLLATGFWGVFGGWLTLRFITPATVPAQPLRLPAGRRRIVLGAYATAWTLVAMGVAILGS
ncbi:hypothetical protein [Salinarimonas chemoclinalis]|uniref:hypothetical protein n=1 Tax=Salinarimonas chemoclinalis TaxID=3241599 RepID=UPI003558985D